jgi:hypothetical protein
MAYHEFVMVELRLSDSECCLMKIVPGQDVVTARDAPGHRFPSVRCGFDRSLSSLGAFEQRDGELR